MRFSLLGICFFTLAVECAIDVAGLSWFIVFYHGRLALVKVAKLSLSLYKVSTTQRE
jgi:hypothetical protein